MNEGVEPPGRMSTTLYKHRQASNMTYGTSCKGNQLVTLQTFVDLRSEIPTRHTRPLINHSYNPPVRWSRRRCLDFPAGSPQDFLDMAETTRQITPWSIDLEMKFNVATIGVTFPT